jgi:hypothetical protein
VTPTARELDGVDDFTRHYAEWGRETASQIVAALPSLGPWEQSLATALPEIREAFRIREQAYEATHGEWAADPLMKPKRGRPPKATFDYGELTGAGFPPEPPSWLPDPYVNKRGNQGEDRRNRQRSGNAAPPTTPLRAAVPFLTHWY